MERGSRGLGRGWRAEGSATGGACAACRHQRRKCTVDCPLAPYFPPDRPEIFRNAHRLFGVSNILKILRRIDPTTWPDAMRSIISEANLRQRYPINGCVGFIYDLSLQIRRLQRELDAVNEQLAAFHLAMPPSVDDGFGCADPNLPYPFAADLGMSVPVTRPFGYLCFDDADDRQSRIDSDEPYNSSLDLESLVTDTTHPAMDELFSTSHLKSRASACFSFSR